GVRIDVNDVADRQGCQVFDRVQDLWGGRCGSRIYQHDAIGADLGADVSAPPGDHVEVLADLYNLEIRIPGADGDRAHDCDGDHGRQGCEYSFVHENRAVHENPVRENPLHCIAPCPFTSWRHFLLASSQETAAADSESNGIVTQ